MSPGTEFARDFCAGIGPLQLGVVLVLGTILLYLHNIWITKLPIYIYDLVYERTIKSLTLTYMIVATEKKC